MWYTCFFIPKWHTWHCEVWWKIYCINHLFFPCYIYIYTHCSIGNYPLWGKYTIMDFHELTNTGSLQVIHFQPHRFQGIQLDQFHNKTTVLFGIGQIIVGGGRTGRVYLRWFLLVVEQGTAVSGYSWCQIFIDPEKKWSHNICISWYMLFYQISLVWTSWNMKPMPVMFSLVPLVNNCPTCGIFIGTLVW